MRGVEHHFEVLPGRFRNRAERGRVPVKDDPLLSWLKKNNEPYFIMDENPTAENLSKLIYHAAKEKGFSVVEVRFWETETSFAAYSE